MFKKVQQRFITLLEIMIVIFLIALIGGVVAYNMRGSLDEGKRFKTVQAQSQIQDILLLQLSEAGGKKSGKDIAANPVFYLRRSGLLKDPETYVVDGWGDPFEISYVGQNFRVHSKNLEKFEAKKGKIVSDSSSSESAIDY